jgi:hypothetical protein
MRGHPQACSFAMSYIIILPHHVMFYSKHDTFGHAKWLVLQRDSIYNFTQDADSTKIIRKLYYTEKLRRTLLFYWIKTSMMKVL